MTHHLARGLLCGTLFSLGVIVPSAAPAVILSTCQTNTTAYTSSGTFSSSTTSMTFKNIPEAEIKFKTSQAGCVLVRFSAQTFANGNNAVIVTAHLGTNTLAPPTEVQYSGNDNFFSGAHSYDFIFPDVPKGNHTLQMKFRSVTGVVVFIDPHTTVVQYNGSSAPPF